MFGMSAGAVWSTRVPSRLHTFAQVLTTCDGRPLGTDPELARPCQSTGHTAAQQTERVQRRPCTAHRRLQPCCLHCARKRRPAPSAAHIHRNHPRSTGSQLATPTCHPRTHRLHCDPLVMPDSSPYNALHASTMIAQEAASHLATESGPPSMRAIRAARTPSP